jgi:biotin transport system substrate-specific component
MLATRLSRVPPFERGVTLGDFFVPIRVGERAAAWQRSLVLVLAGTLLMVAGAYVSIDVPAIAIGGVYLPANPYVPLSLQTFAVLFTGATLGLRRGMASSGLYLLLGAIGLPVFALDPQTGVHAAGLDTIATWSGGRLVLGVTGGYLIGFVLAAAVVGRLAELGWDRTLRGAVAAMLVANSVVYIVGLPWLALATGLPVGTALQHGLWPFIPGDLVKLAVAAGLLPVGWWAVRRRAHDL